MAAKYQLLRSDTSFLAARDQAGEHPGGFFRLIAKPGMRRCVDETSAGATSSSGMHFCAEPLAMPKEFFRSAFVKRPSGLATGLITSMAKLGVCHSS